MSMYFTAISCKQRLPFEYVKLIIMQSQFVIIIELFANVCLISENGLTSDKYCARWKTCNSRSHARDVIGWGCLLSLFKDVSIHNFSQYDLSFVCLHSRQHLGGLVTPWWGWQSEVQGVTHVLYIDQWAESPKRQEIPTSKNVSRSLAQWNKPQWAVMYFTNHKSYRQSNICLNNHKIVIFVLHFLLFSEWGATQSIHTHRFSQKKTKLNLREVS